MKKRGQGGNALMKRRKTKKSFVKLGDLQNIFEIAETPLGGDVLDRTNYLESNEELISLTK